MAYPRLDIEADPSLATEYTSRGNLVGEITNGMAIIASAKLLNGLDLVGKRIEDVKVAVSGAGAAALACLDVLVGLGVQRKHIFACDSKG